jgi:outer membrane protein TolC
LYSVIKNSNYNLKSLELATKVNEELVNIYQSEYYPTIALFGNYAFQGQANDFNFQVVKSSAVGVSFSLNLFQGFQSQNRVQQARIDYLSTKEKYTQLLETYKMAINNAIFKMQVAQEKVKTLKANVDQAKRGFDIAQIRYKEGVGNQVEINDANTAFSQANLSYFKALYDLIDSQIEMDNILGNLPNKYLNEIKN